MGQNALNGLESGVVMFLNEEKKEEKNSCLLKLAKLQLQGRDHQED